MGSSRGNADAVVALAGALRGEARHARRRGRQAGLAAALAAHDCRVHSRWLLSKHPAKKKLDRDVGCARGGQWRGGYLGAGRCRRFNLLWPISARALLSTSAATSAHT